MSARLIGTILLFALATALPAQGQEKYTLKLTGHKPKQGDDTLVEKVSKGTGAQRVFDKEGKLVGKELDMSGSENLVYRETVLTVTEGAAKPIKLKRHYLKDDRISKFNPDAPPYKSPYLSKTVLIEKKGEKYHFQIEGGEELTGVDAKGLNAEFNKKKSGPEELEWMSPGKPVAVGETWKLPLEQFEKGFGGAATLDAASKGTATLVKVYQKDGRQFGVLKIDVTVVFKAAGGDGKKEATVQTGSKMTILMDLDICIDGSADLGTKTMRMGMDYRMRASPDLRATLVSDAVITEHRKVPGR